MKNFEGDILRCIKLLVAFSILREKKQQSRLTFDSGHLDLQILFHQTLFKNKPRGGGSGFSFPTDFYILIDTCAMVWTY